MTEYNRAVVLRVKGVYENLPIVRIGQNLTELDGVELWEWNGTDVAWVVQTSLVSLAIDTLWEHHELARKYHGESFTWAIEPIERKPVLSCQHTTFCNESGHEIGLVREWIHHHRGPARYISWPHDWNSSRHIQIRSDLQKLPAYVGRVDPYAGTTLLSLLCARWGFPLPRQFTGRARVPFDGEFDEQSIRSILGINVRPRGQII